MPPGIFLIDAIGPFFRGAKGRRTNWSKIPYTRLTTEGEGRAAAWEAIRGDLRRFTREAAAAGFNAVTLDDLAHLAPHPRHEPEVAARIAVFREEFSKLFEIVHEAGLAIYLTTDVLPVTAALEEALGGDRLKLEACYRGLVEGVLRDFPRIRGLVLRIGESDGVDVKDPIRTRLYVRSAQEANRLLRELLPVFEKYDRTLILRTWTVGAHRVGDLIWHRGTLATALAGIDSPNFVLSMKYGESDFFRYLPLNRAFFRTPHRKIVELQARREYEGAGEYPSFIGWDCERLARELGAEANLAGISVWCQTGGWHRFRRLAFLEDDGRDFWLRLNSTVALRVFRHGETAEEAVAALVGAERAPALVELLRMSETVVKELHYIRGFAEQKLFFRRVRIPPLLHVYWDCLFINHAVRKVLRHFVADPEQALREGEAAYALFPRMIELARAAELPVEDIEHWRDFCHLLRLARRYYFLPFEPELAERIRASKKAYKKAWPAERRDRYRIKISFDPFPLQRQTIGWLSSLFLRRQRGYRVIDHILTLNLLGLVFRLFRPGKSKRVPKFLRKSAMGVEALFR